MLSSKTRVCFPSRLAAINSTVHQAALPYACTASCAAAQIEALCDRFSSTPPCPVIIEAAGELPPGSDLSAVAPVSAAGWPLWPEDQGPPPKGTREAAFRLDIAQQLKQAGNEAYKKVGSMLAPSQGKVECCCV
jgi:hypothetical protein